MKRTFKSLLAAAALAFIGLGSLLTATPAQAVVTCQKPSGPAGYPYTKQDGSVGDFALYCFSDPNNHRKTVFDAVHALDPDVKLMMQNASVKIFFFQTRADAVDYFNNTFPYNTLGGGGFAGPTTMCGNTGFSYILGVRTIASMAYDTCRLDQNTAAQPAQDLANPELARTIVHESGHAFSAVISNGATPKASSTAFTTLFNYDRQQMSSPPGWSTKTQAQKEQYICAMFSTTIPSKPEINLGATNNDGGPFPPPAPQNVKAGKVCQTVSATYPDFSNKTPLGIANLKMPYFVQAATSNHEAWAELWVIKARGSSTISTWLQMTDRVMGDANNFKCTKAAISSFYTTGGPPATLPTGCPSVTW
jgi:hypothetical protein